MKRIGVDWSEDLKNGLSLYVRFFSKISLWIRLKQYKKFEELMNPKKSSEVLDVGTTPPDRQIQADVNFFEKVYPHKNNLTIASIEDCRGLAKILKLKKFVLVKPGRKLSFKDKQFDIVTSWATLEHVGKDDLQRNFLLELDRIGKKVFVTLPYKYAIYEPHTKFFFIHWLPDKIFRTILKILKQNYWEEDTLRIMKKSEVESLVIGTTFKILIFKIFNILPSHIIIFKTD